MLNMLTSRWLSLVFFLVTTALLLGVVGYTARALADAPPNDEAQPDVSDPAVVKQLADELFDAMSEGDGTSVWDGWSDETREAVVELVEDSVVAELNSDDTPASSSDTANGNSSQSCDTHSRSAIGKWSDMYRLFEYKSSTYWCWDGTQITIDPSWNRYAYEFQSLVKFVGHTHSDENGGQGDLTHYDYTRGHFKICLSSLKLVCPFNLYPWIEKQQHYDGDTWYRIGNG